MRVLLDEQVPVALAPFLTDHEVATVKGVGWAGVKNGELLKRAAEAGFEAFLTMDQNLQFQQNLATRAFGVLLVRARSNRLHHLEPLVPAILRALITLKPGELIVVGG